MRLKRRISVAALCVLLSYSPIAVAEIMYMVGNIAGTVNGKAVDYDLHIKMDMETGEETATVGRMDPEMGAILRQVTAMVTVAGPTGGMTPDGVSNLFELSGGNFVNMASMFWPRTGDRLELEHRVSYTSGDTMTVVATINGTVPVIRGRDAVKFDDFSEIMYWGDSDGCLTCDSPRTVTTGVGFRGDFSNAKFRTYRVGDTEIDPGGGKGSTTLYSGPQPSGTVVRTARDITVGYDPAKRMMHVHLYNTLTPVEAPPAPSR